MNAQYTVPDENIFPRFPVYQTSSENILFIYPVPPVLNCSGGVSAVKYCYRARDGHLGTKQHIFTLLTLTQNGLSFSITDAIAVRAIPRVESCYDAPLTSNQYCCGSHTLDTMDQFNLPAANFAFGILPSSDVNILGYNVNSYSSLLVEHYEQSRAGLGSPIVGERIAVGSIASRDRTLRAFQLVIGESMSDF